MRFILAFSLLLCATICYAAAPTSDSFIPKCDTSLPQNANETKTRQARGTAYIDFNQGKADILPGLRNNRQELDKIEQTIRNYAGDDDITIDRISITGYASPEGKEKDNLSLSERRTDALMNYIRSRFTLTDGTEFVSHGAGEDWEMLAQLVTDSDLNEKEAILALINDNTLGADDKEKALKKKFPTQYNTIFSQMYPKLRRSYYVVDYTVRNYDNLDRIQRVYQTDPTKLSLYELYWLLSRYYPGTDKYYHILCQGAVNYPDDWRALLNAGYAWIMLRDYVKAYNCLYRICHMPLGIFNLGVLEARRGNYKEAVTYFSQVPDMTDAQKYIKLCEEEIARKAKLEAEMAKGEYEINGHMAVDLGLPSGTLWATCNIGATRPEEVGDHISWGEKNPKKSYTTTSNPMFNMSVRDLRTDNHYTDDLNRLIPEYDAATQRWGEGWRMPDVKQVKELRDGTTNEPCILNGVKGTLVTSKYNGKSIFLPYSDSKGNTRPDYYSSYWTRSVAGTLPHQYNLYRPYMASINGMTEAHTLCTYNDLQASSSLRHVGLPIRPVAGKQEMPDGGKSYNMKVYNTGEETKFVDLGLPSGTLWADQPLLDNRNYGLYVTWGEIHPEAFTPTTMCKSVNWMREHGYLDASGNLDSQHDPATIFLGEPWRMPTLAETQELLDNCDLEMKQLRAGGSPPSAIFTSRINGNSITVNLDNYPHTQMKDCEVGHPLTGFWTSTPCDNTEETMALLYMNYRKFGATPYMTVKGFPRHFQLIIWPVRK